LKLISIYANEKQLLKKAAANNRQAQQAIYDKYAPKMLSVCRQYIKDVHFAEDVMVTGFVKVFKNLNTFEHRGSFEGWMRMIMVRESISYLRKKQFVVFDSEMADHHQTAPMEHGSLFDAECIQEVIDRLPEGYKMVFMLYAIEGYKHHEIAQTLGISEGTSKSQLFKARKMMQEQLSAMQVVSKKRKSN